MNERFSIASRTEPRRRGAVLVLFALLTFVFFAIAAVVIDIGLANLTQQQMQVATDSAALEGCRWRNFDESLGLSNDEKRKKAAALVRLVFDDDLDPTRGGYKPDNYDFGTEPSQPDDEDRAQIAAGPALRVSGGSGAWAANAVLDRQPESEVARIDDPRLQTNRNNRPNGDQVAGWYKPVRPHNESGDYTRRDFAPAAAGVPNALSLSYLVRMRRAGDGNPADVQSDVSSSLPTLPVVFGLGSTILQDPGNDWDPRRDGITVRATSIACARPAMRVGRPPCDETNVLLYDHEPDVGGTAYRERISGLVPFFLYRTAWTTHFRNAGWQAEGGATQGRVKVQPDGSIVLDADGTVVGHFMFDAASAPATPCESEFGWPEVLGRAVPRTNTTPVRRFRFTTRKPAYIAIVEPIPDANGVNVLRVIGYGFAHLWPVGFTSGGSVPPPQPNYIGTGPFVISPGELITNGDAQCWIAQDNASAILKSAANETSGLALDPDTLGRVLTWSNRLAYGVDEPDPARIYDYTYIQRGTVLAPALTR